MKAVGAWLHSHAPHSAQALYASSAICALLAVLTVYVLSRIDRSHKHLPVNWIVLTAAIAAPVPTWALLIVMPLDPDLGGTISADPVVVALAGLYGLVGAFRDARGIAVEAHRRMLRRESPDPD